MAAAVSTSVRDAQDALLWSAVAAACFVGVIDRQQLRIRWNAALRKLYELSPAQSLRGGPLLNDRVDAADRHRIEVMIAALISQHQSLDCVFNVSLSNGITALRVVAQRVDETNRIVGLLQKCHAAEAMPISQDRWQSVGRLTLLDEVTSAMAHELNQPLAAISMFAQVGERMLASPEPKLDRARQVFQDVSQQALRAGDLIHRMRSLVKRQPRSSVRLSIAELIRGFESLAEPMARTHRTEFTIPAEFPNEYVLVDVAQINQVLFILFHNALDAANNNDTVSKTISVATKSMDGKVTISITDSGAGVAPGAAAQLFQPFFSTKENGTGLGLVSARNILETYGSQLEFENLEGGGCCFSFALPVANGQ